MYRSAGTENRGKQGQEVNLHITGVFSLACSAPEWSGNNERTMLDGAVIFTAPRKFAFLSQAVMIRVS